MVKSIEEAKDLTSDVFIKAFENIGRFDTARPFKPWIYQIATNLCIDHIRRKYIIRFQHLGDMTMPGSESKADCFENAEQLEQLKRAIGKLKSAQKRCFMLFYIQNRSYHEISEITGYSANEVRSFIQNGKRNFIKFWQEVGGE
jgi:RNA polymerase sigma-70 factor (ECF subfamily)